MVRSTRKFYFTGLGVLLALSAYPVVMGVKIVILQVLNGSIRAEDYARYVIPYTAVCLSVLLAAALYPSISRLRKFPVLTATVLALGLFVGIELFMEHITINSPGYQSAVQWQLTSCIGTIAAKQAFLNPYNDTYKIHYFLVSFVIITLVVGLFYGYGKLFPNEDRAARIPLRLQLAAALLLLALCVYANFTGFFRNTSDTLSPLSSILTAVFFVVLGAALGIYAGSRLIGRGRVLAIGLPAAVACAVSALMYFGEYNLLGGTLYRFGFSFPFQGLPGIALAPADFAVILAAGAVSALVMGWARSAFCRHLRRGG